MLKKAWEETETRYYNKPELRHYLKKHIEGGVGGAGQAMADGNQTKLLNTWRLPHTRTHTPSRVREKCLSLHSFLGQH